MHKKAFSPSRANRNCFDDVERLKFQRKKETRVKETSDKTHKNAWNFKGLETETLRRKKRR